MTTPQMMTAGVGAAAVRARSIQSNAARGRSSIESWRRHHPHISLCRILLPSPTPMPSLSRLTRRSGAPPFSLVTVGTCVGAACVALWATLLVSATVGAQSPIADSTATARIAEVARRVIEGARFATFVTLDSTGRPRSRTVHPASPDSTFTVWFATNPRTRKVVDIGRDGRVVLHYFDEALSGYVSLIGRARVVRDRPTKEAHWSKAWDTYYPDRDTGVVLVAVTAERLEVVCTKLGIEGDKGTWLPPAVSLTSTRHRQSSRSTDAQKLLRVGRLEVASGRIP